MKFLSFIDTLLDSSLANQTELFMESGDHSLLIRVEGSAFMDLLGEEEPVVISEHL
ncbi:MAG: hypothetical protein ABW166_12370 [Sedimenticola sp.]